VVVPTRDRPQLLRASVKAIVDQEYPGAIEVIVVYDQSQPDMSLDRGDDRRRVRVITNTRSPGLAGARNTGILAATGKSRGLLRRRRRVAAGQADGPGGRAAEQP
jgi:glycosyltransferase involved in cell wall biosynthesis